MCGVGVTGDIPDSSPRSRLDDRHSRWNTVAKCSARWGRPMAWLAGSPSVVVGLPAPPFHHRGITVHQCLSQLQASPAEQFNELSVVIGDTDDLVPHDDAPPTRTQRRVHHDRGAHASRMRRSHRCCTPSPSRGHKRKLARRSELRPHCPRCVSPEAPGLCWAGFPASLPVGAGPRRESRGIREGHARPTAAGCPERSLQPAHPAHRSTPRAPRRPALGRIRH